MEKVKITNNDQFSKLVELLETNPALAQGLQRGSRPANFKEQWEKISMQLNAVVPPIRNVDGWQKVWRDHKFKVKKKLVANKIEARATGGDINKQFVLRPLEEAVANLVQFQELLSPEGMVQGIERKHAGGEEVDCIVEVTENELPEIEVVTKEQKSKTTLNPAKRSYVTRDQTSSTT